MTKGSFTVALSGGSTPKGLYGLLATDPWLRGQVPWDKIHVFWGDERHVPPTNAEEQFTAWPMGVAFEKPPSQPAHVYPIKSEHPDAGQAANDYAHTLREFFSGRSRRTAALRPGVPGPWGPTPYRIVVSGHEGTP